MKNRVQDRARGVLVSAKRVIIRLRQELTDLTARHDQSLVDLAAKEALIKVTVRSDWKIECDYLFYITVIFPHSIELSPNLTR